MHLAGCMPVYRYPNCCAEQISSTFPLGYICAELLQVSLIEPGWVLR